MPEISGGVSPSAGQKEGLITNVLEGKLDF